MMDIQTKTSLIIIQEIINFLRCFGLIVAQQSSPQPTDIYCYKLRMSIYSGFATRQQETKYNNLLENILLAFKRRISKFYKNEPCDEQKFKLLVKKVYKQMVVMEKNKFLLPKYSTNLTDLIQTMEIQIDYDSLSDMSSVFQASISIDTKKPGTDRKQYFKSGSILQQKKNTIKRALNIERQRQQSAGYFKNLTHLEVAEQVAPLGSIPKRYSLGTHPNGIPHQTSNRKISPARIILKKEKSKRQLLEQIQAKQQIKYGVPAPPSLQDFIPARQEVIEKVEELSKLSQSRVSMKTEHKNRQNHRSFRRHKFQKPDLHLTQI